MQRSLMFSLVTGCLLLASCADDLGQEKEKVIDGLPVTATLSFQTSGAEKVTKASEEEENRVNDLYVLIFDGTGAFSTAQYFTSSQLDAFGRPNVKIQTFSGSQYIYAAANVTGNSFTADPRHLKDDIDDFIHSSNNKLADWKTFSATIKTEQVTWGDGRFLMTGFYSNRTASGDQMMNNNPENGLCTISKDGAFAAPGKIQLIRAVSSFTFNLAGGAGVTFIPNSWKVVNAAKSVYLYKQPGAGTPDNENVFATDEAKVTNNTFNFYLLENRQTAKKEIATLNNNYAEADLRESADYAPDKGTYIILKGKYEGTAKNPFNNGNVEKVEAQVTYRIHLGYINRADEYDVLRNYKYTYNIRIDGIDKIIVEADNGDADDETHRADGDAMFYDAEILDVDAHYDRIPLTLDGGTSDFLCGIQTVKTGFVYTPLADATGTKEDINWVLFILQSKDTGDGLDFTAFDPTADYNADGLMNIRQLTAAFKAGAFSSLGTNVPFYAYVNENYYDDGTALADFINYDATSGELKSRMMMIAITRRSNTSGSSSVSTSKYIIRQKPITTIYNLANTSVAGQQTFGIEWVNESLPTNYANLSSFRQKAASGLDFGSDVTSSNANSHMNGLGNMKTQIKDKKLNWKSDDIQVNPNRSTNNGRNISKKSISFTAKGNQMRAKAYAACMNRNRDENGNGVIDDDEIKWYLPAINQYQYLWVGMDAIPDAATLYPKEFRESRSRDSWEFYHYGSSDQQFFWSEEGNAVQAGLNTPGSIEKGSLDYGYYHIRCARNLGKGNGEPINIAIAKDLGTMIEIDVDGRLNDASLRAPVSGPLSSHNEYDSNNRLSSKLLVQKKLIGISGRNHTGKGNWKSTMAAVSGNDNPCEKEFESGWRAPSQRELILITTVGGLTDKPVFAATYYSFYDYNTGRFTKDHPANETNGGNRYGFSYVGVMTLSTMTSEFYVRCVKDL